MLKHCLSWEVSWRLHLSGAATSLSTTVPSADLLNLLVSSVLEVITTAWRKKFSEFGPQDLLSHLLHAKRFCQNISPTLGILIPLLCLRSYPSMVLRPMVRDVYTGTKCRYHRFYSVKSGPYQLSWSFLLRTPLVFLPCLLIPQVTITHFPDVMLETHWMCLGWVKPW